MDNKIALSIPLFVYVGKKKFNLNLNEYRNAHYQVLAKAKKQIFFEVFHALTPAERKVKIREPVVIVFRLFKANKRRLDLSNVCSVADKFVCDALVEIGILKDDDCSNIPSAAYDYGGIDTKRPRVEISVFKKSDTVGEE